MKIIASIVVITVLSASMSMSLPVFAAADPTASIDDTFQKQSRSTAHLFYIEKIDGIKVHNALKATTRASNAQGSLLNAMGATRSVSTQPIRLHLVGRVRHVSLEFSLTTRGANHVVEGELTFTPQADTKYLVSGKLSADHSAVWIEDINGVIVSDVIEKIGDASETLTSAQSFNLQYSLTQSPPTRLQQFLSIASGESPEMVEAKLGVPDRTSEFIPGSFSEKSPTVSHEYVGMGIIVFSARNSVPLFVESVMPASSTADDLMTVQLQLNTDDGLALQHLAKSWFEQKINDPAKLDLFAEKIWQERNTQDRYTIDALSYLCLLLGQSNNGRYSNFLELVSSGADSKKLRKHATAGFERLPQYSTNYFVPKSP